MHSELIAAGDDEDDEGSILEEEHVKFMRRAR